jgi:tetratricopeptide (TPR) repeat protein
MMLNASQQRPIVFVVEDLHWIDRASEELFSSLVDNVPGAPILFLSTYRPGYRPPWLERSYATQMALTSLSVEDGLTVIRSLLQSTIPNALASVILDKADGNPFFLEELCRAVEEQSDLDGISSVPDTIQEVLLARIQRLPAVARALLQTASVLGRDVSARLLGAIWTGPEPVGATLALLTSLEFLYPRSGGDEPVYVFKHALTQEVAYGTLEPTERRAMHAAAGHALEHLYQGRLREVYDRLAHHYSRTDETAKAVEYLMRFAEKSARGYAHEEAVKALDEARNLVERLPAEARDRKTLELAIRLPASLLPLGRLREIYSVLLEQRERLERLNDPGLAAQYHFLLSRAYILGRHDLAGEHARRAIIEAQRCGDTATMGEAYGVLALAGALSGQAAEGIEHGRRAVAFLEKTDEQSSLCYAYWALGLCCSLTGAFADAIAAESRALEIAETIGDQPLEASAAWAMGIIHAAMGEHEEGVAQCQRAVEKARDTLNRAITTGFLGFAYLQKGDPTRAIAALEASIPYLHQFGLRAFEGWFTALLAEAHRLEGRFDQAEPLGAQALQIATESKFGVAIGWAHQALGRVAHARGDYETATKRLTEALAVYTTIHARSECARTHLDLAAVCRAQGDREAASRHLGEAYALFKALGVPRYRERVEHVAADWGMAFTSGSLS